MPNKNPRRTVKKSIPIAEAPQTFREAVETKLTKSKNTLPYGSAEYMVKKLQNVAGLSKVAAIGAVANLYAESKLDPSAKQKLSGGKIGRGRGLAQWETGGRWDTDRNNMMAYAKSKGVSPFDLDAQLEFIGSEMDTTKKYGRVRYKMNKETTVGEATNIFLRDYEKAGIPHTNRRLKYAEELKKKIDGLSNF